MPSQQIETGISRTDASRLIRAKGGEFLELLREASALRDARSGPVITYSRKVFIPLTNLCRDRCGYCTFAREPGDGKTHTMSSDEVLAVARAGRKAGCKEALFSLGDKPELRYREYREWLEHRRFRSTIEYLRAMCQLVFEETGLLPYCSISSRERTPGSVTRDLINPELAWPQIGTLRAVTQEAGFELRERLAAYPEYLRDSTWMAESLRQRALAWTDEGGMVA